MSAARDTVTDTRLRLRAAGFSPTPVNGKAAVLSGWQNKRDVNDDEIKLWNNLFPHASGTGILTVHTPVFDIDISNEEAAEAVERLARERFEEAGRVLVRIGRPPKRAIPFRSDNAFKKISINLIAANGDTSQKLELLAAGQQLVAFGIHPDTQLPYRWHGGEPGEIKREELPEIDEETAQTLLDDAAELLCRDFGYQHAPGRPRKTHKGNGAEADASDGAGAADWAHLAENIRAGRDLHDSLRDLAAKLVASGMGAGAVVNFLRGLMGTTTSEHDKRWLERRYSIPRLVESAQAKQDEQPPQEGGNDIPATSEEAMALTFADRHAEHLRFVAAWGRWLNYDDVRWTHDDTLHAFDLARAICRETAVTYTKATVTSAKTVAAIERLARSDRRLAATAAQWDASPWLLNTGDATIDLRTGIGRAPEPLDYITKRTGCACAPAGTLHPLWTAFLDRVTDHNVELQQFLQRYIGYCCTGFTTEHVFIFLHGTGANGKGTFINTLVRIFDDYATVAAMSTFIASNSEQHPTDLAKLNGARLVVAQETQKGRRWDEGKIKTLTGGDRMTARFMRQDFFDFDPTFKLCIAGNHKPRLSGVDEAIRRRFLLVPFTVQIPPGERDPDLVQKLEPEHSAILRWAVDGCLEWQRIGLSPPAMVREATDDYFADQDITQQWLDDCTHDAGPLAFTRSRDLFDSWKTWCEDRNIKPGTSNTLSEALADKGFTRKREGHTGQRGFAGLAIRGR
jgi:putative DNA primase/helicase